MYAGNTSVFRRVIVVALVVVLLLLCTAFRSAHSADADAVAVAGVEPWNRPAIPASTLRAARAKAHVRDVATGKFIPRHVWIAVRNASDARPTHYLGATGFLRRNAAWDVHFCGNAEKDAFMARHFAGSAFLWAYDVLNPVIGTAKSELWRLAVLFVEGGVYMDDDADIRRPLDEVVGADDQFIVGKESYDWKDHCFTADFALSNTSLTARFGDLNRLTLFDNRFFFNWALFAMPGHALLERIIERVTQLIRREYLGDSAIVLAPTDHRGKLLMCASTFPITLAARELVLEHIQQQQQQQQHQQQSIYTHKQTSSSNGTTNPKHDHDQHQYQYQHQQDHQNATEMMQRVQTAMQALGLRIGAEQFRDIDGDMKAWNNDHNPHRWVKQMNKHRLPYLRDYAPLGKEVLEGKAVQIQGKRDIYVVEKGQRRAFPSLDLFLMKGFTLETVKMISPALAQQLPLGEPLSESS